VNKEKKTISLCESCSKLGNTCKGDTNTVLFCRGHRRKMRDKKWLLEYAQSLVPEGYKVLLTVGNYGKGFEMAISTGKSFHKITSPAYPIWGTESKSTIKEAIIKLMYAINRDSTKTNRR
jgi:hypothetical protein